MKATVVEIQVHGLWLVSSLREACKRFLEDDLSREKISFSIKLPIGEIRHITIRDAEEETVAYGDFLGLPSFAEMK